jgi:hypothetical protein
LQKANLNPATWLLKSRLALINGGERQVFNVSVKLKRLSMQQTPVQQDFSTCFSGYS